MKKQLLIASALLFSVGAFAQNRQVKLKPSGILNQAEKLKAKFAPVDNPVETQVAAKPLPPDFQINPGVPHPELATNSSPIISANWVRISGSYNILGMIVSSSKPLQYNRYLDLVSFIQRRSTTFSVSPTMPANAASGPIVAMLGKQCGLTWDSTLVFADPTNWSRYPQGGIYSPAGNSNIENAYAVAMGPITANGGGWVGSYYATKTLTSTANRHTAGTDQQFMSHTAPFGSATSPTMPKHYFPRHGFTQCDNGMVYSLGGLYDEYGVVTAGQPEKYRGGMLAKGNFVSGAMVWTSDSMVPPVISSGAGARQLFSQSYMAWDDAGQVGYVVFIGARAGSTNANKGWQPIVYKTTNGGGTWALVNGIDFNTATTWDFVLNSMASVNINNSLSVPFFNVGEGIDCAVDKNGKLHIGSTVVGTSSTHNDSLGFTWQFTTNQYSWSYQNTAWPYLFDFVGDGTGAWSYKTIDSVGSEGMATTNPNNCWGNQSQTSPAASDMRIQMSRTYDGEFILYSWEESDSTLTTGNLKWNEFPNIKVKALRMCDMSVSSDEYMVSSPVTGFHPRVRDKAFFHYMSRQSRGDQTTMTTAQFTVPVTVSNNPLCLGDNPIDTYYARAVVSYSFASPGCTTTTGFINNASNEVKNTRIYPNPAKNTFNVGVNLNVAGDVSITVYNAIGQKVSSVKTNGQIGENTVAIDMNNANAGVYFVKIKSGTTETTKKLILE